MLTLSGVFDKDGKPKVYNMPDLTMLGKKLPGRRFTMSVDVYEPGASSSILGYYFKKIVPDFQQAFKDKLGERLSLEAVDESLRSMFPGARIEEVQNGKFVTVGLKTIAEMPNRLAVEFIDHIRMIAAQEFDLYIEDPNTL